MRRTIVGLAASVAVVVTGGLVYLWLAGGSGEPSTDLTTPPLAADTTSPDESVPDGGETTTTGAATSTTQEADESELTFVLDQEGSTATFTLDEELRGAPERVVGATNEVAGQLRFDPSDLASAAVSPIVVNARTFQTDSSIRDRAVRGPVILDSASDEFELITFEPTVIEGLAGAAEAGDTLVFAMVGDLSIKGVTVSVTFDVEATWADSSRLEGIATSTVDRTDFGIGIPNVANVANVTEAVELVFSFTAVSGT